MSPRSPQVHMHEDGCNIGNHPLPVPCRHIPQAHTSWCNVDHGTYSPCKVLRESQSATLTTSDQLDELPVGTVVRDAVKDPWRKLPDGKWGFPSGAETVFVNSTILARAWGPVTLQEVAA